MLKPAAVPVPMNACSAAMLLQDMDTHDRARMVKAMGGKVHPASSRPFTWDETRWIVDFFDLTVDGACLDEALSSWIVTASNMSEARACFVDETQHLAPQPDAASGLYDREFSEEGRDPRYVSGWWFVGLLPFGVLFWVALHMAWKAVTSLF